MHDLKPWVFFAYNRSYNRVVSIFKFSFSLTINVSPDQFVCKIAKRNSQSDHSLPLKKYEKIFPNDFSLIFLFFQVSGHLV